MRNKLNKLKHNVLPCCGKCNLIRGDNLTVDEMKVAMNSMIEFRKKMLGP